MKKQIKRFISIALCVLMLPFNALAYTSDSGYFLENFSSVIGTSEYKLFDVNSMTVSGDVLNISNYSTGNKTFGVPYGAARHSINKAVFEDTDNAVVMTYDAYIPHKTSNQTFMAYIGYQKDVNGDMPYTQYLARAGQLKTVDGKQHMGTVDATFNAVYGQANNMTNANNKDENTGAYKTVALDLGLTSSDAGKWYTIQTVLEYDKTDKKYISSTYVDGQPIRNEKTGNIARFVYAPDAGMLEEIQSRASLSFVYLLRCGTSGESGKDIKLDNISMHTYGTTLVDKVNVPQTVEAQNNGKAQITIPFKQNGLSSPELAAKGIMNTDDYTADKIKVYKGSTDITESCSFASGENGELVVNMTGVYNADEIRVKMTELSDIRGRFVTDTVSFTITGDEKSKLTYDNEYYYEDFSDYDGSLFNQEVNNYYTNAEDAQNVYSVNYDTERGKGVKITNNTGAEKLFNGPRGNTSVNFKMSPAEFENKDGAAIVYSFDAYITPGINRTKKALYAALDATTSGYKTSSRISISPIYVRYYKGYDMFYTTLSEYNGLPVNSSGNSTDFIKIEGNNGRWVNMQSMVRYDKANGQYVTTHYIDGKPIRNVTSNEISEVRAARTQAEVDARTELGIAVVANNATTDPVDESYDVDNMSIRQYRKTELDAVSTNVNSVDTVLTIPVKNSFDFTNPYAPKTVTEGILNTETITAANITVKCGEEDISSSCDFSGSTYDKIRIKLPEAIGTDTVTVSITGVKDILNETVAGNITFTGKQSVTQGSVKLECVPVYSIFEGNNAVSYTLKWSETAQSQKTASFEIRDYYDRLVYSAEDTIPSGTRSYVKTIPYLKYGNYKITAAMNGETVTRQFAVVPRLNERRASGDNGFGITAMVTHAGSSFDKNNIDAYAKSIAQAGFGHTREFGLMNEMEPIRNNPYIELWHSNNINYDEIINAYSKYGIKVSFMFSGDSDNESYYNMYTEGNAAFDTPTDLIKTYQFAKSLAQHYSGKVDIYEIGNEVDSVHNSPTEGADTYAAFLKAAALGIKDAGTGEKIAMMGLVGDSSDYRKTLHENDVADFIDIYNYHSYTRYKSGDLQQYDASKEGYHSEMERYGLEGKEVAVTEQGYEISSKATDMTEAEEKAQAQYAPTSMIASKATGTNLNFWYNNGYHYNESSSMHFGNFTSNNEPCKSYSAFSAMNNAIGNGQYIGRLTGLDSGTYAYCFRDGTDTVVCLWSDTDAGKTVTVPTSAASATLTDIMGNDKIVKSYTITVGKDIQYLRFAGELTGGLASFTARTTESTGDIEAAQKIVLQQRFPIANSKNAKTAGYNVEDTTACTLRVFNLNNKEMTGTIYADIGNEWTIDKKSQFVTVDPMSYADLTFNISSENVKTQNTTPLRFSGIFDNKATSDSVSSLTYTIPVNAEISTYTEVGKWTHSATTEPIVLTENDEITFGYDMSGIEAGSGYSIPYLTLPSGFDFTENDGIVVSCKGSGITETRLYVYLYESSGEYFAKGKTMVLSEEWQQIAIPFSDFGLNSSSAKVNGTLDLRDIIQIRIGFSPTPKAVFSYTLKDVGLYKDIQNINEVFVENPKLVTEGSKTYVAARFKNYNTAPITAKIFIAVKDAEGSLESVKLVPYISTANMVSKIYEEITLTPDSKTVTVYYWDSEDTLIPKSRNVSVDIAK